MRCPGLAAEWRVLVRVVCYGSTVKVAGTRRIVQMPQPMRRLLPGLAVGDGICGTLRPGVWHADERAGRGRNLKSGHRHDRHNTAYYELRLLSFRVGCALAEEPACGADRRVCVCGCGRGNGRAVLLASELSFREVVGVELNPALARIARKNVGHGGRLAGLGADADGLRRCGRFPLPDGPCVAFLFNPLARR